MCLAYNVSEFITNSEVYCLLRPVYHIFCLKFDIIELNTAKYASIALNLKRYRYKLKKTVLFRLGYFLNFQPVTT